MTCILYHYTICTSRHDLVFYATPIPHSNLKNFYITCPLSFLNTIRTAADHMGATIAMLQAAKKTT